MASVIFVQCRLQFHVYIPLHMYEYFSHIISTETLYVHLDRFINTPPEVALVSVKIHQCHTYKHVQRVEAVLSQPVFTYTIISPQCLSSCSTIY